MKFNLLTDLYTVDGHKPNFTIITPGPCNAKCGFCFWNAKDGKIKPPQDYFNSLIETLKSIPHSICPALSISGGEPTISPHFENILKVLDLLPRKWDRIVLTTNGTNLNKWLDNPYFQRVVTHINISRHHYDDAKNQDIFRSGVIPSADQIRNIVKAYGNKYKFNINCVTSETTDSEFIYRMIVLANFDLRLPSISFRKEAGDVSPSPVEQEFVKKFGVESSNNCPVCRTTIQANDGFRIMWKGSHPEPSQHLNKLYELVFHPNGKIYGDWSRKIEVDLKMEPETQEGKFWFNRWASLVREFDSYKGNVAKSSGSSKKIQGGCHSGGDDVVVEADIEIEGKKPSKIDKVNKKLGGCSHVLGDCSSGCGSRSRVNYSSCGGGSGCGGGC